MIRHKAQPTNCHVFKKKMKTKRKTNTETKNNKKEKNWLILFLSFFLFVPNFLNWLLKFIIWFFIRILKTIKVSYFHIGEINSFSILHFFSLGIYLNNAKSNLYILDWQLQQKEINIFPSTYKEKNFRFWGHFRWCNGYHAKLVNLHESH